MVTIQMVEYSKVNVRLSNTQLQKLQDAVKDIQEQLYELILKCLIEMIYHMNYYL